MPVIIGIDASRCLSGGAVQHIKGIITNFCNSDNKIKEIHLWSYTSLINDIPDYPWLVKHNPSVLDKSLLHKIIWQMLKLKRELLKYKCDILFSADATTVTNFKPMIVLSQDLLSYENGIMNQFGFGLKRLRLIIIYYIQNLAFKRSIGVIFLTNYTSNLIQKHTGKLNNIAIIPHGSNDIFLNLPLKQFEDFKEKKIIECLYISNVEIYKNHINVLKAVSFLREKGFPLNLTFIGGGNGSALKELNQNVKIYDPNLQFLQMYGFINNSELPKFLANSDIFIFASSCETWGITLLEAMSSGLPIVCSNKSSLPEVLRDSGLYFNPADFISIANAIETIIINQDLREYLKKSAKSYASLFTWKRCSLSTFSFIIDSYNDFK
jgi:glycosyltransferase involved in cell wall biosynthesis